MVMEYVKENLYQEQEHEKGFMQLYVANVCQTDDLWGAYTWCG